MTCTGSGPYFTKILWFWVSPIFLPRFWVCLSLRVRRPSVEADNKTDIWVSHSKTFTIMQQAEGGIKKRRVKQINLSPGSQSKKCNRH